jgi:hypothetical protein
MVAIKSLRDRPNCRSHIPDKINVDYTLDPELKDGGGVKVELSSMK